VISELYAWYNGFKGRKRVARRAVFRQAVRLHAHRETVLLTIRVTEDGAASVEDRRSSGCPAA
jgi:hypothetical protein